MLIGYIRITGDRHLDEAIEHALAQANCTAIYSDQAGGRDRPGLQAAFRAIKPGDALCVGQLAQFGIGAGGLIKLVGELRDRGLQYCRAGGRDRYAVGSRLEFLRALSGAGSGGA